MLFGEKRDEEQKEGLKEAFAKVKKDIFSIGDELSSIKTQMIDYKAHIELLSSAIDSLKIELLDIKSLIKMINIQSNKPSNPPFIPTDIPSDASFYPSNHTIPSNNPTVPVEIRGSKSPILDISSGNEGVPTDRQTNQQTDNLRYFSVDKDKISSPITLPEPALRPLKQQIQEASDILDSLDSIKKEIRLKFKQITQQEMLVFSTIYQLEEQFPEGIEYRQIASRLKLSESSIRDYVQKLISKGIPVDKIKLNNKKILLKISSKLRSIAPLEALIRLREL
jgi:DNA repair exonuclease SbcCD ATPase subunit